VNSPITEHSNCLIAGIVFAVGVFIILRIVDRMVFGRNIPRDMQKWQDEVERVAVQCIQADLWVAESKARLVELIGQVPKDFDPTVFLGCQIAAGIHRAVLIEAEKKGLVNAGLFEKVYGVSLEQASLGVQGAPPPASLPPPPSVPPPSLHPAHPPALRLVTPSSQISRPDPDEVPDVMFVNGRCIPKVSTA
jgi:hypothetical protein